MDGSRTHRGSASDPPPVLKTGEPTGTQPPPTKRPRILSRGYARFNPGRFQFERLLPLQRQHAEPESLSGRGDRELIVDPEHQPERGQAEDAWSAAPRRRRRRIRPRPRATRWRRRAIARDRPRAAVPRPGRTGALAPNAHRRRGGRLASRTPPRAVGASSGAGMFRKRSVAAFHPHPGTPSASGRSSGGRAVEEPGALRRGRKLARRSAHPQRERKRIVPESEAERSERGGDPTCARARRTGAAASSEGARRGRFCVSSSWASA